MGPCGSPVFGGLPAAEATLRDLRSATRALRNYDQHYARGASAGADDEIRIAVA